MKFDAYHPALNLLFFVVVIAAAIAWTHPVFVGIAYVCAFAYSVRLNGLKALIFNLALMVFIVTWGLWYATNTHFGVTNLGETIYGNSYTLESLVYGMVQGVQIATVIMWMSCVFLLFTADKVVYLLGKVSPRLSLMLAVALRAVPVIKDRAGRIAMAQCGIGRGPGQGGLMFRAKNVVRRTSVLISWSIERFVETSDSMKSRGSLLKKRTAYSLYRFDARDRALVITMAALIMLMLVAMVFNQTYILYDPQIIFNRITPQSFVFYGAYAVFCLLPLLLQTVGEARFKALARKA